MKFKWTKTEEDTFNENKRIVTSDTLLAYPDFNEYFKMNTDTSKFQLEAVISQKGKFIALYSIKLTDAQKRYAETERELLFIVKTLKELRAILLDKILGIDTDNKNPICKTFNTGRVLRWIFILEESSLDIEYIKGDKI